MTDFCEKHKENFRPVETRPKTNKKRKLRKNDYVNDENQVSNALVNMHIRE